MRLSTLGTALVGLAAAQASIINYSAVTGYFLQDEASTDASTFDYVSEQIPANYSRNNLFVDALLFGPLTCSDSGELRPDRPLISRRQESQEARISDPMGTLLPPGHCVE